MNKDSLTSIVVAIVGVLIGYFVCNLFVGDIDGFTIKTVDSSFSTQLVEPSVEVFNYRAINPTVEVYVGDSDACQQYDDNGECADGQFAPESSQSANQETP